LGNTSLALIATTPGFTTTPATIGVAGSPALTVTPAITGLTIEPSTTGET
jgi:hypothetical protein